jgi:hypothetical protein
MELSEWASTSAMGNFYATAPCGTVLFAAAELPVSGKALQE